ncbi:MAG: hypothetical protein ABFC28_08060 [Rikenellaceae bacterium]
MKIETTKERIVKYLDYKGIKLSRFYAETDLKRGLLDSDKLYQSISDMFVARIVEIYSDLNIEWLVTGKGEMLKCSEHIVTEKKEEVCQSTQNQNILLSMIEKKDNKIEELSKKIGRLEHELDGLKTKSENARVVS